jgi:multidrug efflux pump subunit AcrA (membrane-fusion protein)
MSVRKILWTVAICGGGFAAAAYAGFIPIGKSKQPAEAQTPVAATAKQPDAIAVTVAPATTRTVERRVKIVGTLRGYEEIDIGPLVDGHVRRVLHDVGDVVQPGEPLVEIDDSDFRLAVQEMRRALELELSRLGLTALPEQAFDVTKQPSVIRAQLVERNAADTLERYKSLVEKNAITKDEFAKSELNLDVARLDTKQRILEAEQSLAAVRHRQAILETAEKKLRDTRVVVPPLTMAGSAPAAMINLVSVAGGTPSAGTVPAPAAYTVAERVVSEGEIVRASPPTKLFRLVVENPLKFQAAVSERFASRLRPGQTVDLLAESLPGQAISGRVVRVNPTVDTASRTFQIEVAVPNAERLLKPGSFATASILLGTDSQAVTVPEEAIVRFAGVSKVFTVADGKVTTVPLETETRLEVRDVAGKTHRWVEVVGPLKPGVQVVTTGHAQLADGTAVRVRATEPAQEAQDPLNDAATREARRLESTGSTRKDAR